MVAVGWIGIGRIGLPMASRLKAAGHDVIAWDLSAERRALGAAAGLRIGDAIAGVAAAADPVMICVPDGAAVEQVVFGSGGIAGAARAGSIIVDHSTIAPEVTTALAGRVRDHAGLGWVDAPVSGGVEAAAQGKLVAWLGGERADVDQVLPFIRCYAAKVMHVGAAGRGQMVKCCNQMIVAGTAALWSQMLRFAQAAHLDAPAVAAALEGGAADSAVSRLVARAIAEASLPPQTGYLWAKDLRILVAEAAKAGADLPMAAAALAELERFMPADKHAG